MKKLTLIISLTAVSATVAAQSSKESLTKKNIAADNRFLNALQTGNTGLLDGIIAPEFFNHTGEHRGLDSLKRSVTQFHQQMKPLHMDLFRQLADDEYVADWVRYNFADPKAKIEGIEMTRYRQGKAVEHWFFPSMQKH